MEVITSLEAWKTLRRSWCGTLGLVPTMGSLHEGHLSLVHRALAENERVVVWNFVNPKQFGPQEDYRAYPRDRERDAALLRTLGTHYMLSLAVEEVYPAGFQTEVCVRALSQQIEGARRPGHFLGVATVVAKMLCLISPQHAYFGQKDGQQCRVVQQLAADLGMLCEIVVLPTVREADGLALSSRNRYLSAEARAQAPVLYEALCAAAAAVQAGCVDATQLREGIRAKIATRPLARLEYVSVADAETLEEQECLRGTAMISLSAYFGPARLIDNVLTTPPADLAPTAALRRRT